MHVQHDRSARSLDPHAVALRGVVLPDCRRRVAQCAGVGGLGTLRKYQQGNEQSHRLPVCDSIVIMSCFARFVSLILLAIPLAAADSPAPTEGDFVVSDFAFAS